ncbi:MAG: T9SS type A sorting domain-containing protein [Bacteroidota bacterium]
MIATDVISSAGETSAITPELILSWTLGESVVETYSDGEMLLVQGFHQPVIKITAIKITENKALVSVFPNPAVDQININLQMPTFPANTESIKAELRDIGGRLVYEAKFEGSIHKIDVHLLSNGAYILTLTTAEKGTFIGSYKVEKLK